MKYAWGLVRRAFANYFCLSLLFQAYYRLAELLERDSLLPVIKISFNNFKTVVKLYNFILHFVVYFVLLHIN